MAKKTSTKKKSTKASSPKRSRRAKSEAPVEEAANDEPSPDPIRKHARQGSLPGTSEPDIDELDELCAKYKDHDDSIIAHKRETTKLRGAIAVMMEKHGREEYSYLNKDFEYTPGAPKLKVKTRKTVEED